MMEKALERYYEHFGQNYPMAMGNSMTEEEVVARIDYCIKNNTPEDEPEYDNDCDY